MLIQVNDISAIDYCNTKKVPTNFVAGTLHLVIDRFYSEAAT